MLILPHAISSQDWCIIAKPHLKIEKLTSKMGNKQQRLQSSAEVVKVVVIGEPQVGKTSFIRQYWEQHQPEEIYQHNGATVYPCEFRDNERSRRAVIYEIPGDPAFGQEHRTPHYLGAQVIVWMYAIDDPVSLEILRDEWIPEAGEVICLQRTSSVLVGNKVDLRDNPQVIRRLAAEGRTPVTVEQAEDFLLRQETILDFSEISANSLEDVEEVFEVIVHLVFHLI